MKLHGKVGRACALILAAALAATLTACGEGGGASKKGRYVEETVLAQADIQGRSASMQEGQLTWLGEQGGKLARFAQNAGEDAAEATVTSLAFLDDLIQDGGAVSNASIAPDGTVYAIFTDKDGKLGLAQSADGKTAVVIPTENWSSVGNQWQSPPSGNTTQTAAASKAQAAPPADAPGGGNVAIGGPGGARVDPTSAYIPQSIAALDNGYLISYAMQGVVQYDAAGKEVRKYSSASAMPGGRMMDGGSGLAVYQNTFAMADTQKTEIVLYDLTTGKETERAKYEDLDSATYIGMDAQGLYVADAAGISRWQNGAWELIVDGGLTSLIMPDLTVQEVVSGGEGIWYAFLSAAGVGLSSGTGTQLVRFRYDASLPAQPDKTLTVFSLYDNTTVRLAIGEFQRANPDVRVTLNVGIEGNTSWGPGGGPEESQDSSATVDDVVRALNTELLAGKGPDLIILDGLPLQSYIEKGVLKDISALAQQLTTEENLLGNLTNAYALEGKTYGLPTRFSVPVMLGDGTNLENINSLEGLVSAVKFHGSKEPALLGAPGTLWGDSGLIMYGYDACVGNFVKQDGSLDEAALADYLNAAYDLTLAMRELNPEANQEGNERRLYAAMGGGGARRMDVSSMSIANGEALIGLQTLDSAMSYAMLASQLGSTEGMEIDSLFRQGYFTPVGGAGITAAGKQQELAESFLKTLVGSTVQDNFMADAFPVNRASWSTMISQLKERFEGDGTTKFNDMGLLQLCESLKTPLFVDQYVKNAVEAQAKAIVDGSATPQEAAVKIVADTRLYLAE